MNDGRIKFGMNDKSSPKRKLFLNERLTKGDTKTPSSILLNVGTTKDGTNELSALFDNIKVFDYPKPTSLIEKFIKYAAVGENDIVLDFFSGSASTAHGLMLFNYKYHKRAKFILVQIQEELVTEHSLTVRTSKRNSGAKFLSDLEKPALITEIGKERIRRAGAAIKEEFGEKAADLDIGFRVLKLDSSNMKDTYYVPAKLTMASLIADNLKEDRTSEDLLFQALLETDVLLSEKIEHLNIGGKEVFSVSDGFVMACFDNELDMETIKEIAYQQPSYFITRYESFNSDALVDNLDQIFAAYSSHTIVKII